MNEAPQHMTELRQRVQEMFPRIARISQAATAVNNLGATEEEQKKMPTVEVKDSRGASAFINWTGSLLAGMGETLVVLYLLLASGDLFLQKLVRVMPTFHDKKRAVEISHKIQQNISNYLFSVSLINLGLGAVVSSGLHLMDVPNAVMWGMLVAILNFVPYFGPVSGIILLATVGLLTFETPWKGLLPPAWYLLLHLLEAKLDNASRAGAPVHAQSGGHLCFVDLLDLALGCAGSFVVGADPGVDRSCLRSTLPRCHPSANCSRVEPGYKRIEPHPIRGYSLSYNHRR